MIYFINPATWENTTAYMKLSGKRSTLKGRIQQSLELLEKKNDYPKLDEMNLI